jgi:8-amino-7-oxononanoate synthase
VESGLNYFQGSLEELKLRDQLRIRSALDGLPEKHIVRAGKKCLNLSSNNYLGLAGHAEVRRAAAEAALSYGTGSGGSRLLGGGLPLHAELETALCRFRPLGQALLFNTGYMANLGVIQAMAPVLGPIFSDKLNHASVTEALKSLPGNFHRYRHKDMDHLETLLKKHLVNTRAEGQSGSQPKGLPGLVCSETLFSMDGDFAPLQALLELQARYGFFLYLDEAHSTGCYHKLLDAAINAGIKDGRILIMGTFGKAFGGFGAYVAGSESAIEFLVNQSRSFIFSTALPPATVAGALAALKVAETESWRAEKLSSLAKYTRSCFKDRGLEIGLSESHIVPVIVGSNQDAVRLSEYLYHAGYHAPPVRHPTVPVGKARLRINLTCEMENLEMDDLAKAIANGL